MAVVGIIPSRYGSTRFPGKPLIPIKGKPMVQWVYESCKKVLEHLVVATDDERIYKAVTSFGGSVIMTSPLHDNGTSRCLEALQKYQTLSSEQFDGVINIQGDEPLVHPQQVLQLKDAISSKGPDIATLAYPVDSPEDLESRHDAFVVFNQKKRALYFSRTPLPYVRDLEQRLWLEKFSFYRHIGMYAFRDKALAEVKDLTPSKLELAERLEQNRWLDHGLGIQVELTKYPSISVDIPKDLEKVEKAWDSLSL